jgi:acetolactate synthase I/II/III large subunit
LASKPVNSTAVRDFIERNNLPVVGTFQAAGAIGAHLYEIFGGSVDVLSADLDHCYRPYVELTGDIAQTLNALTLQLRRGKRSAHSSRILQSIVAERNRLGEESASRSGTPVHPLRIVHELQPFLNTDLTLCLDMGSSTFGWRATPTAFERGRSSSSTASRPWVSRFHLVWIDGTYDMVGIQEELKYGRKSGVDFGPVDLVKYAQAFGATGLMIRTPDEIGPTLKNAFSLAGPVIVGVHVDYRDNSKLFEMVREDSFH